MKSLFSTSAYSTMLMGLPTSLIHSESVRLSNELVKRQNIARPEFMGKLIETKIQLIDLEIQRRDKNGCHVIPTATGTSGGQSGNTVAGCSCCRH